MSAVKTKQTMTLTDLLKEIKALRDSMKTGRIGGTGPSIRRHACSSCGLTDEEWAKVEGWNEAMDDAADRIDKILEASN